MNNNYNEEIVTVINNFVKRMVDDLNRTNDNGITDVECNLSYTEDTSVSNYLTKGVDAFFLFNYSYKFKGTNYTFELKVPRQVGGVFVIKGKLVIPYMELSTDFRMKVHKGILKIDNNRVVIPNKGHYTLVVKDSGNEYSYNLSDASSYSQIPEDYLKIDEDSSKIAQAKTLIKSDKITTELCDKLFEDADSRGKVSDISDITITSTADYVRGRLNKDYYSLMNEIRYKFKGGDRSPIGYIYVTSLNTAIYKYFSISEGKFNYFYNVTNPLTIQSLSSQVKAPHGNSFNASVFDLIDIVDTPINNHLNKINYLNRNVKLTDGGIEIQVYTKDKKRVYLNKLDYCITPILNSDCWDYRNWKLKPEYEGKQLEAKIGKFNELVDSLDDVAYIELDPNDRTSITSHVIPMINKSEFGRMSMGTSMTKQGVNLINPEEPLVTTEDLSDIIKLNPLIIVAEDDGEVTQVTRTYVEIEESTRTRKYDVPYALTANTGNIVPFIPVVGVGQSVKKGEIIITPNNLGKNTVRYGVNAIACFNSYLGYNSDDAVVISESFAKRISSVYVHKQVLSIFNAESIKYIKNSGTKVNSGDILVDYTAIQNNQYSDLLKNGGTVENVIHKTVMNNIADALIFDVNVALGSKVMLTDESYDIIDGLNQNVELSEYKNEIPNLPETSDMEVKDNEIKVEFSFLMLRKAYVGDKLTNRYGNKGVIAKIVPDDEMIKSESGLTADICFSRESLPARKNVSQIFELYLGQISKKIKSLWESGNPDDKKLAVGVYNTLYKTSYSVDEYSNLVKSEGNLAFAAKVGTYSDISAGEVLDAIDKLGISIKQTAYIKGRKLASKVLFGPMYIMKLPYLPENTLAITASKKIIGNKSPLLGTGKTRGTGQKFGEMESTAMAVNAPDVLAYYKQQGGVEDNVARLYFNFLDLGIDISGIATTTIEDKKAKNDAEFNEGLNALKDKYNS
jgi:hypothetical protein